jgi:hypothetical protein
MQTIAEAVPNPDFKGGVEYLTLDQNSSRNGGETSNPRPVFNFSKIKQDQ